MGGGGRGARRSGRQRPSPRRLLQGWRWRKEGGVLAVGAAAGLALLRLRSKSRQRRDCQHAFSCVGQYRALLAKNLALCRVGWPTVLLQLLAPLALALCLALAAAADAGRGGVNSRAFDAPHPRTRAVGGLPVCDVARTPECAAPLAISAHLAATSRLYLLSV